MNEQLPAWHECTDEQKEQWVQKIIELWQQVYSEWKRGNPTLVPKQIRVKLDDAIELRARLESYQTGDPDFDTWKDEIVRNAEWVAAGENEPWIRFMSEQDLRMEELQKEMQRWMADVQLMEFIQTRNVPPDLMFAGNNLLFYRLTFLAIDHYNWLKSKQRIVLASGSNVTS